MNHVPAGVLAIAVLDTEAPPGISVSRGKAAIEEIIAVAHAEGDWRAVHALHAVAALLAAWALRALAAEALILQTA